MFNSNRKSEPPVFLGSHERQVSGANENPQAPRAKILTTERLHRSAEFRRICAERGVTDEQLARHWEVSQQRASVLRRRESGPPSEKLKLLPVTWRPSTGESK